MIILEKEIEGRPGKQTVKIALDVTRSVRRSFMEGVIDDDSSTVQVKQWHWIDAPKVVELKVNIECTDEDILAIAEKFNVEIVEPELEMPGTLASATPAELVAEVDKRLALSAVIMLEGKLIVAPVIIDPIIKETK